MVAIQKAIITGKAFYIALGLSLFMGITGLIGEFMYSFNLLEKTGLFLIGIYGFILLCKEIEKNVPKNKSCNVNNN